MPLSTHHSFSKLSAHFRLYDSLFVILYNIWKEDPGKWTNDFENIHKDMHALAYKRFMKKNVCLENDIRKYLYNFNPNKFLMSRNSDSVVDIGNA